MHAISLLANHSNDRIPGIYRNRRKAMQDPKNDPTSDTMAPPTDREVETHPIASLGPMLPPATVTLKAEPETSGHGAGDDTKLLSTNQLIALYTEFRHTQTDILSETGGFASMLARRDERLVSSFARLVEDSVRGAVTQLEPRFRGIEHELAAARREASEALALAKKAMAKVAELEGRPTGVVAEGPAASAT
jgi:hypothetical protein